MGLIFANWDLGGTVGLVPGDLVLGTMDLNLNQLPEGRQEPAKKRISIYTRACISNDKSHTY